MNSDLQRPILIGELVRAGMFPPFLKSLKFIWLYLIKEKTLFPGHQIVIHRFISYHVAYLNCQATYILAVTLSNYQIVRC